jgi:streptogramin lyase
VDAGQVNGSGTSRTAAACYRRLVLSHRRTPWALGLILALALIVPAAAAALSQAGGTQRTHTDGPELTSPSFGRKASATPGVSLASISASTTIPGTAITEFSIPTLGSQPDAIAAGPDGNLWFTEFSGNQIGRITPAGMITEFPVTTGDTPSGIAAGADGNMWFIESRPRLIGQINPATGAMTFASQPLTGFPRAITAGPDGNLWVAETNGDIGQITTAGVVSEFSPTNPAGGSAEDITAGPDGNLWFTYDVATSGPVVGYIGQITTSGQIQQFPLVNGFTPGGITDGPDGNLWFTETGPNNASEIGQITPSGVVTNNFVGPTSLTVTSSITAGPDGNLWFTDGVTNIGQITTTGIVTEVAPPTGGSGLQGITVGPDQNVWFAESHANQIGRLTLPPRGLSAPVVSGSAVAGQVLSTSNGSWSNAPTGFGYQWERCDQAGGSCVGIAGATGSSYVTSGLDVGQTLVVVVSASNAGGSSASVSSAPSGVVATPTTTAVGCSPTSVTVGQATTCTATVSDGVGALTPSGVVAFSSSAPGGFGGGGGCLLSGSGGSAGCSVLFTPGAAGSAGVVASYAGDSAHGSSRGSTAVKVVSVKVVSVTGRSSLVSAVCSPGMVRVGEATLCTVRVSGASGSGVPGGSVTFAASSPGGFGSGASCRLSSAGRCSVRFTPASARSSTITITVAYGGDAGHDPGSGLATVAFPAVAGVAGDVRVLSGTVVILPPASKQARIAGGSGGSGIEPLTGSTVSIPIGSTIDARRGTIAVSTAADFLGSLNPVHRLQNGVFAAAMFTIEQLTARQQLARQKSKRRPVGVPATKLVLTNAADAPRLARCRRSGAPGKGVVRSFRGVAKGVYETVGAASTTMVQNATWSVQDRCDGTLTRVQKGRAVVAFVSHRRRRTVTVRAGQSYIVAARFLEAERVSKGVGRG